MATPAFTVPGMDDEASQETIELLSERLVALLDLQLTLKHIHWNVVGPDFIAVHEMLDPQVDAVRAMTDATAERIATMGGVPKGTPGTIVDVRSWDDYPRDKDTVPNHLRELDKVYTGVITDHRSVQERLADLDAVSEDMIVGQLGELELFQWFVRAHLESADGKLS